MERSHPKSATPLLAITLCALMAVRQWARVRRAFAETVTPEDLPLRSPAPRVAIILPVRDEAANIDAVVASLLAQEGVDYELLVLDDGSTDATPALLAAWAARDARLLVKRIDTLPPGWAGKAHALHIGAELTTAEWLLFTDADTRHAPAALRAMLGHATRQGDDLLSLIPEIAYVGPGMRLLTPLGGIALLERATPAELRDPLHAGAIAIGQYILIRRAIYERVGGYANPRLRATFADDVHLAEEVKRRGGKLELVSGRGLVTNEQWTTWDTAWRGWRKSIYGDLVHRPLYGLAGGLTLLVYGLLPPLALLRALARRDLLPAALAIVSLVGQVATRRPFDRVAGLPWRWTFSTPLGWATMGLLLLDATRHVLADAGADWKGRAAPGRGLGDG
ncbi:MAG: Glycosyl transferase, family 2 [uncultured Thermomicrobiales bacterium]|uniref:Glycosyl transferase, family 2 n=1 Tax=uncultured Thermomicrobiales bacterium TaxID=1645740 RepID=A0A6J4VY04_9BACT|nr:MAG: Glycosyl transferase, family 2 [uncultured Thermomicrobiales bacterium]